MKIKNVSSSVLHFPVEGGENGGPQFEALRPGEEKNISLFNADQNQHFITGPKHAGLIEVDDQPRQRRRVAPKKGE